MHLQYTPYIYLIAITAVLSAALTFVAWQRHGVRGALPFGFLSLAIFEWSVGYGLELTFADLPAQVFWAKIEYFGIVAVPLAWLAFALIYTGREQWLTLQKFFLLSIVPLITLILVWTNDWHGLVWSQTAARSIGPASIMSPSYGAWFWVHTAYSYALILAGSILILQMLARAPNLRRGQVAGLVISALAPWVGNAIYLLRISPFAYLDLTPFAFTVSGLALAWDMARYQLLDIVPIARELVIESMDDAVLVLDARNRIVDLNPAAQQLLGRPAAEVIGSPIQRVLSAWNDLLDRYLDTPRTHDELSLGEGAARRWFDLRISPLRDGNGRLTGRLVVVGDISKRKRSEETQTAAFHISEAAHAAQNLDELFQSIHSIVGDLMPASSFYIALYNAVDDRLTFPYWADEHDPAPTPARPGKGLTEYVLRTGEPLLATPEVFAQLVESGQVEEIGAASLDWLGVPLKTNGKPFGVLAAQTYANGRLGEAESDILVFVSEQVAMAIERVRAEEALRRALDELEIRVQERTAELATLYDLSRALAAAPPSIDPILHQVARHAVNMIQVTLARVLLLEDDQLAVRAVHPRRALGRELKAARLAHISAFPLCHQVLEHDVPRVLCADDTELTLQERDALFLGGCRSICIVPLRADNRPLGVIVLGEERSVEREPFTGEKIRLARSIGDQAVSALHRAQLFEELESAYLQTVLSLAKAVEAKDTYTGDHVQRVAQMAEAVGRELGMSDRELAGLRFGAILHDIGKIGIPDAILNKPGSLDAEEWKIMRQHPGIGERILAPIPHLQDAAQIVRHHHERFDGRGYPDGLVGDAIPLGARILTVVDSFSAMVDKRVYKPGRSVEEAWRELGRCAGTQFDPRVVDVFLRKVVIQAETQPMGVPESAEQLDVPLQKYPPWGV